MTIANWIKENGKNYQYREFTVATQDGSIIVDDRLVYLKARSPEYNKSWKAKCRGKKIIETRRTEKGIILIIA